MAPQLYRDFPFWTHPDCFPFPSGPQNRKAPRQMEIKMIAALLNSEDLPGTPEELAILGTRLEELIRRNGRQWIIDHRRTLIAEWTLIVDRALIR